MKSCRSWLLILSVFAVEAITVEAITVDHGGGVSWQLLLRWLLLRWSLLRQLLLIMGGSVNDHCWGDCCSIWGGGGQLMIAVETIAVETIAVHLGGGGVDRQSLLRWSLLRWLLFIQGGGQSMIAIEVIAVEAITVEMIQLLLLILNFHLHWNIISFHFGLALQCRQIRRKDKHCNLSASTYLIMCSPMANCMLLSAELQTHQLLLCAWITQKDLQETLCFKKFCDFPCTLCPQPWDFFALPPNFRAKHGLATSIPDE